MDDTHYFKPQKKLIEFERHNPPVERRYRFDDREITLSVYAEGKRTFESRYAIDRRFYDDVPYPAPDPTVHYCALARVKHDSAGGLEPGRFVIVKAFECEELGFGDTERLYVKPRPGERFPKALKILT